MGRSWRIVMAIAIAGALCACSLASGWSDLQEGRPAGDASTGTKDTGTAPDRDGAKPDSSVTAEGGLDGVQCGAGRCLAGQGCCLDTSTGGAKQCTTAAECASQQNDFLSCTRASSCTGSAPVCCFDYGAGASTCFGSCGAGQYELCDTSDRQPCSKMGAACTNNLPGTTNVPICQ